MLHASTAAQIFYTPIEKVSKWQRDAAKIINFGIVYGMSPFGLADQLGMKIWKAKNFIDRYFQVYPLVYDTLEQMGSIAIENNYSTTLLGRKRYFPPGSYAKISRQGKNSPIQGSCGDTLKLALQLLYERLKPFPALVINIVHDEILVEANENYLSIVKTILRTSMIDAGQCFLPSIPIEIDITIDQVWKK